MSNGRRRMILASLGLLALHAWIAPGTAAPGDWIKVPIGSLLTLEAPPGTRFETQRGADSFVGTLIGPGFELQLDYGVYSDPLTDQSRFTAYSAQTIVIDGKPATIVRGTPVGPPADLGGFIGLHIPQLGQSGLGSLSLTISSVLSDSKQEALVRRIFDTIRLKPTL